MTYPDLSTVNATSDLSVLLVYANDVTQGYFGPLVLGAFFLIVLIGSLMAQYKFSGRIIPATSFAAASFAAAGFAIIMASVNGLINPIFVILTIVMSLVGVIWLVFSSD